MSSNRQSVPRSFVPSWIDNPSLADWISEHTEPGFSAYCSFCELNLRGSRPHMIRHAASKGHLDRCAPVSSIAMPLVMSIDQ